MGKHVNTTRSGFIDIAKGLGIFLVIFGHMIPSPWNKIEIIIYGFHMPMFFFFSGLFASNQSTEFLSYLKKQAKRLLVPFLVFFGVGTAITFLVPVWSNPSIEGLLKDLVYASPNAVNVGPIWFLAAMFDVAIIFFFYNKFILSKNDLILTLFSLSILAIIAFYLPFIMEKVGVKLPFRLDVSLMALVFYTIGYLFKSQVLSEEKNKRNIVLEILLWISNIAILVIVPVYINGMTFLSGGFYGHDVFMYALPALSGTWITLKISKLIGKNPALEYIGRNSLVIFSLHAILTDLYNRYIMVLFKNTFLSLVCSFMATFVILIIMVGVSLVVNKVKDIHKTKKNKGINK